MKTGDWIKEKTGRTESYWMRRIGTLIGKHSKGKVSVKYKGRVCVHGTVEVLDWFADLSREVERAVVKYLPSNKYDENMAFAAAMSFILMRWFVSLVRAKAYDGRRPVKGRQKMMNARMRFCIEVVRFMVDESRDHLDYPAQKWDPPFSPGARDGTYV